MDMMDKLITVIISLVSVTIGWLLNELSIHLRFYREQHASIGKALSYLLQIWFTLEAVS